MSGSRRCLAVHRLFRVVLWFTLLSIATAADPARFRSVLAWQAEVSLDASSSGDYPNVSWSVNRAAAFTNYLVRSGNSSGPDIVWNSTEVVPPSQISSQNRVKITQGEEVQLELTINGAVSNPSSPLGSGFLLIDFSKTNYMVDFALVFYGNGRLNGTALPAGCALPSMPVPFPTWQLPDTGLVLSGSHTTPMSIFCNLSTFDCNDCILGYAVIGGAGAIGGVAQVQWTLRPKIPEVKIVSVSTPFTNEFHTFISTDTITLKARLTPPLPNVPVKWTVTGKDAAAGVSGFPQQQSTSTDSQGISTFQFTASQSAAFVANRRTVWKRGRRTMNDPITFEVTAETDRTAYNGLSRLSESGLLPLSQDPVDILRQEYVDFEYTVAPRADLLPSGGPGFNVGPYPVQLDVHLQNSFNAILAAYRGRSLVVNGKTNTVPATAQVLISRGGGFRNPQQNVAAGSTHNRPGDVSRHVFGAALDLVPVPMPVLVDGQSTMPDLHAFWYPALHAAAATQGSAIAEKGCCLVPLGSPLEDHIHVQW